MPRSLSLSRNVVAAGLTSAAALIAAAAVPGCGGSTPQSSDAVVVTDPTAPVPTASTGAAPATGAPATTAAPAPSASADTSKPAATTRAEGFGTLKGQIVFGGAAPKQDVLYDKGKAPKDPEVCGKDAPIVSERLVVDGGTKGVKNALVYLVKPTAVNDEAKKAAAQTEVEFDQKNCVFRPHVLGVYSGSKITLKSSDPVNHNINAKMRSNTPFNSILSGGQSANYTPSSAERQPALVTCDIHPWMQAYWMVFDHPYFAVTDDKGNFEIKNVPAGTQKVVVWQEAAGFVTPTAGEGVEIAANGTKDYKATVDPGKIRGGK